MAGQTYRTMVSQPTRDGVERFYNKKISVRIWRIFLFLWGRLFYPSIRITVSLRGPCAPSTRMRSISPVRLGPVTSVIMLG